LSTASANLEDNELSCVLIPAPGVQLLLPNVSVAEIMPWRRIKELPDGPQWCMGHVAWRGQEVPVVHYASFADETSPTPTTARCLVVMNRARSVGGAPFYALAADGLPRILQLIDDDLHSLDAKLGAADVMHVRVGTEAAVIPDLAFIERAVAELS